MAIRINRRQALATGAASLGLATTLGGGEAAAGPLKDVWGQDFLKQWSPPSDLKRDLTPGTSHIRLSQTRLTYSEDIDYGATVKAIRDQGYTACEANPRNFAGITDSKIREMQAALKQHDVEFYGFHIVVNIIDPDETKAQANRKSVAAAVELADRLGLRHVLTHTGGRDPQRKDQPHPDNWTRETWQMSVNALKQILRDTSGSKIPLALEAVNSCNNNTPQSHVRIREDVGDPRIKVTLDPTNMLDPGLVFRTTELINLCFDLLADDICYCHCKDVQWNGMLPGLEWVVPGTGVMDFGTYLVRMSRLKEPRPLYIEFLPAEQYPIAKKNIEDIAKSVGVKIYGT